MPNTTTDNTQIYSSLIQKYFEAMYQIKPQLHAKIQQLPNPKYPTVNTAFYDSKNFEDPILLSKAQVYKSMVDNATLPYDTSSLKSFFKELPDRLFRCTAFDAQSIITGAEAFAFCGQESDLTLDEAYEEAKQRQMEYLNGLDQTVIGNKFRSELEEILSRTHSFIDFFEQGKTFMENYIEKNSAPDKMETVDLNSDSDT